MIRIITKSQTLIKTLIPISPKSISTLNHPLDQLPPPQHHHPPSSLPPSPSTGSPLYNTNWRSPLPPSHPSTSAVLPLHLHSPPPFTLPKDVNLLTNLFADWVTSQRWGDIKDAFEQWIRSLDVYGKPNRPNVDMFNLYLRASLMCGTVSSQLIQIVDQMELYALCPNTASFNLVLKAINPNDWNSAVSVLERMLQSGNQSQPNDESFDIVIGMLFGNYQADDALKYVDLTLESGYMLSPRVFADCVGVCVRTLRLDTLVSIIEKCQAMDQNKALSPSWNMCNTLAEVAIQNNNGKLTFMALGFMSRLMQRAENEWPPVYLVVSEGLVIKSLSTAARTYEPNLLDASWAILKRSLREKKSPIPETYLAKITALASLVNLPSAFKTLSELEKNYISSSSAAEEEMLSPFTSLHPLVVACAKNGHETLDVVYFQLEKLSRDDPPYKSVAALNCVILGCANVWDLDRAYQTFDAISSSFGLTPNIHSYNALLYALGKLRKTTEAAKVFEHLISLGVKPNAKSYSLLVDAHLVNRDPKAALAALGAMIDAGFEPCRATLMKVERRCLREMDREAIDLVQSVAKQRRIILGPVGRRNSLFNMEFTTEYRQ